MFREGGHIIDILADPSSSEWIDKERAMAAIIDVNSM